MNKLYNLIEQKINEELESINCEDKVLVYVNTNDLAIEDFKKITFADLDEVLTLDGLEFETYQTYSIQKDVDNFEEYSKKVYFEITNVKIENFSNYTEFELAIKLERV